MVRADILQLEYGQKALIQQIVQAPRFGNTNHLNSALAAILSKHDPQTPALTKDHAGSFYLKDRWGNPLEVHTRIEAMTLNLPARLLGRTDSLIIWSKGPNGKNEYGRGDDVFFEVP